MKLASLLALTLGSIGGLSACTSMNGPVLGQYQTPPELSFAWDDGVNTYVIPKKGVALSSYVFAGTDQKPLLEKGSYFYINGVHKKVVMSDQSGNPFVLNRR